MGLIDAEFDEFFAKIMEAIDPYIPDLVLIGGCASALYRFHPLASEASVANPLTKDIDIASFDRVETGARRPIAELLEKAGLKVILAGDGSPAMMKFKMERSEAEVEFLCPLKGNDRRAAIEIQKGTSAQPLRYLDLLLVEPWSVKLSSIPALKLETTVRVANPVSYVIQKVLLRVKGERGAEDRAKDSLYIYEAATLFRSAKEELQAAMSRIKDEASPKWLSRFRDEVKRAFGDGSCVGCIEAVQVHEAARRGKDAVPAITPEQVSHIVSAFVATIT